MNYPNNATYFGTAERLAAAYNLRLSLSGGYKKGYDYWIGGMVCYPHAPDGPHDYATRCADTAFAYKVGEIVKVGGQYDVVTGYTFTHDRHRDNNETFQGITLKHHDAIHIAYCDANAYKADIPEDVVALIRSQLQEKCPLKEAQCQGA